MNPIVQNLVKLFAKLPRVGGRAATRIVLSLLQDKTGRAAALSAALSAAAERIHPCAICGCLTDSDTCEYCHDESRANGQICVVRDMGDVWTIEKAGMFHGRYHVLGGVISGAMGITPTDLNIASLAMRIDSEHIGEIIFVLPNTVEGKTTAHYIMGTIARSDITFTELASGVPLGGDLDYIDDGTLSIAFGGRKEI